MLTDKLSFNPVETHYCYFTEVDPDGGRVPELYYSATPMNQLQWRQLFERAAQDYWEIDAEVNDDLIDLIDNAYFKNGLLSFIAYKGHLVRHSFYEMEVSWITKEVI